MNGTWNYTWQMAGSGGVLGAVFGAGMAAAFAGASLDSWQIVQTGFVLGAGFGLVMGIGTGVALGLATRLFFNGRAGDGSYRRAMAAIAFVVACAIAIPLVRLVVFGTSGAIDAALMAMLVIPGGLAAALAAWRVSGQAIRRLERR